MPNADGSIAVRLYHKPLVLLIWLGAVVMVLGGALSLSDRRLRVGAPKPAEEAGAAAGGVKRDALRCVVLSLRLASLHAAPALAVQPDEILADPALEARARALSRELRCMVCQNQSIDDSDAPLARDLRLLVRERLKAGDSDEQGARLPHRALRRVRAAQAALLARTPRCCGWRRAIAAARRRRRSCSRCAARQRRRVAGAPEPL